MRLLAQKQEGTNFRRQTFKKADIGEQIYE